MSADRELLEAAARAAGYLDSDTHYGELSGGHPVLYVTGIGVWDPLGDSGDALELAVNLKIRFEVHLRHPFVAAWAPDVTGRFEEPTGDDPYAATRRAITRAAAELGRAVVKTGEV